MAQSAFVIEASEADFTQSVIEASYEKPVLVDFWAPWCNPCKMVAPILDQLADEYNGALLITKVNVDENPTLAQQYNARSIPTFKVFKNGQVVNEGLGVMPKDQFKALIDPYISRPSDDLVQQARSLQAQGDLAGALEKLKEANQIDPNNTQLLLDIVSLNLQLGDIKAATEIFQAIPSSLKESGEGKRLADLMVFAQTMNQAPPPEELKAQIEADPQNKTALYQLGASLVVLGSYEAACQTFLKLFMLDQAWQDGAAKKALLHLFALRQDIDPQWTAACRRKLQNYLY